MAEHPSSPWDEILERDPIGPGGLEVWPDVSHVENDTAVLKVMVSYLPEEARKILVSSLPAVGVLSLVILLLDGNFADVSSGLDHFGTDALPQVRSLYVAETEPDIVPDRSAVTANPLPPTFKEAAL
jgi:hypothetical protein